MSNKKKWKWIAQDKDGAICKYSILPDLRKKGWYAGENEFTLIEMGFVKEINGWKESLINLETHDYEISKGILIKIDKLISIDEICKAFSVPLPEHMTIADKAKQIVYGDREKTYGDPGHNLRMIAGMWSAYLGIEITPEQVCDMMVQLKIARLKSSPDHEDSRIDIIGYTLLKERLKENENKL